MGDLDVEAVHIVTARLAPENSFCVVRHPLLRAYLGMGETATQSIEQEVTIAKNFQFKVCSVSCG